MWRSALLTTAVLTAVTSMPVVAETLSSPPSSASRQPFATTPLDDQHRAAALHRVRTGLADGIPPRPVPDGEDDRRLVMVSVGRPGRSAVIARGEGAGLTGAVDTAVARLRATLGDAAADSDMIKIDVAVEIGPVERFDHEGRAAIDRSLDGLWLLEPDIVLLPEELLSRRLTDSRGDLQSKRLRRYLAEGTRAPTATFEGNPGRSGAPYRVIRFDSFTAGDGDDVVRLYRGNRLAPDASPDAMLRAAVDGGDYLLRHLRSNGEFNYIYEPKKDTTTDTYNLLRHAGTCYALVELYRATGDDRYRAAADRGLDFLLTKARPPKQEHADAGWEAVVSPGEEAKLGGAALAVLAMVAYHEATGDRHRLDRVDRLAKFLIFQQDPDGHFRSKYFYGPPDPEPFESIYYPGEAILALMRLYGVDGGDHWLDAARAGADWLIDVRDAGKATADLPHDHWLLMALDELDAVTGDPRYAAHAGRITAAIIAAQRRSSPHPDWIGSFYAPPRSTPTATRAEGLVAAARLVRRSGGDDSEIITALRRMVVFQLRCRLTPENVLYLPRPELAVGGFRRSLTNWQVRIDYVQHNISALLGVRSLLLAGQEGSADGDDRVQAPDASEKSPGHRCRSAA